MHARLRAQMTVGIVAADFQRGAFEAGNFTGRFFQQFDFEFFAFAVTQLHALKYRRPILCFSAAGASLNVEKAVVGIHVAGEHAAKFHFGDRVLQRLCVAGDSLKRGVVGFLACHVEQVLRIAQVRRQRGERVNGVFEGLAFFAEFLRAFAIAPDGGIFGEPYDFIETITFGIEVKDTSAAPWRVCRYPRVAWR